MNAKDGHKSVIALPSWQYLDECFDYDTEHGSLIWKARPRHHFRSDRAMNIANGKLAGSRAGCMAKSACGMEYIVVRINKRLYKAHRIVWALINGDMPTDKEIDHIDGNGMNNKAGNLRLVSRVENQRNLSRRQGKILPLGIRHEANAYRATGIGGDGRRRHLGRFKLLDDAIAAREAFNKENGYHSNHGR